ncbi:MAG: flagellar brake protein [Gammaproteobacteria bacterium]
MSQSEMKLHVGDTLQLQFPADDARSRYYVKVIGYLPGQSLLVTTPRSEGRVLLVREGQPFVVRLLARSRVLAFSTSVLRTCARPYPYLHLIYPAEVEQTVVRKAERVPVKLVTSVENDDPGSGFDTPRAAVITDISTAGAKLRASRPLGGAGDLLTVSFRITVGEVAHAVKLPAVIRTIQHEQEDDEGQDNCEYGVEFQLVDPTDTLALHGFVYEQIIKGTS